MIRFISTLDKEILEMNYLSIFGRIKLKEAKFNNIIKDYPFICEIIPEKYRSFSAILVAPFNILVSIYFDYQECITKSSYSSVIGNKFKSIFNYDSYSSKIGNFLIKTLNGFPVHNCNYCDLEKISGYKDSNSGKIIRSFETEHILDKGQCPILALSLYNFVPSCKTCNNQHHKGSNTLGRNKEETILLSPTSLNNRFAEEVTFTVLPLNEDIKDLKMFESNDDLEIDFKGETSKYERTISMFHLKDRYNANKNKIFEMIQSFRTWSIDLSGGLIFDTYK